jgi:hypothetical protein
MAISKSLVSVAVLAATTTAAALVPSTAASAATPPCVNKGHWLSTDNRVDIWVPESSGGSARCTMSQGMTNDAVWALQMALRWCYDLTSVVTDSSFGPATKAALKTAQSREHITSDGIYGPQTASTIALASAVGSSSCGHNEF